MKKNDSILKFEFSFIILLILYLVSGIFLARYYRYEGLHSDAIAYFSIAQKYTTLDFKNAVNGFWSPLFPLLLTPFLKSGVSHLTAARVINVIAGLFLLIGINRLSYRFEISRRLRSIILFSFVPVLLSYTTLIFPDLVLLCILVYYMNIVFNSKYSDNKYSGVLCGVVGAFAYFSKSYAFPFFVSHFLLFNIFHYLKSTTKEKKKKVLFNTISGIVLFCLISSIWVILLSNKYGFVTIGTAGKYNYALINPDSPSVSEDVPEPVFYQGLIEPPNKTAISAMDDPTYIKLNKWSPLQSWEYFKYQIKHIVKNIFKIIFVFQNFSILSIVIITAYLLFCIRPLKTLILESDEFYPLITMILYSAGYALFVVFPSNVRYFWIDNVLLLLMGGQVLTVLFKNEFFDNKRKSILIGLFVLSFIFRPIVDIIQKPTRGERNYALFEKLESQYNIQGNMASNDYWGDTLHLVYYLNLKNSGTYYYGMPKKNQSEEALLNELKAYNIDYYFVWGDSSFLPDYKDIMEGKISGLRIYSLKQQSIPLL